jgi:peptidoglycan hydrolase-like protein with peptidoglycan-binding domain
LDLEYIDLDKWITPKKYKGYTFPRVLTIGSRGFDVIALQEILQANSLFPANVGATGYFGGITRQAVKDFQKKYEESILWTVGLKLPTGYFGKSSRAKLNDLIK